MTHDYFCLVQDSIREALYANVSYAKDPHSGRVKLGYGLPNPLIDLDYYHDLLSNLFGLTASDFEVFNISENVG